MASLCEVIIDTHDPILFESNFQKIKNEAQRIEAKYSRYKTDNIVFQINNSKGKPVDLNTETASLMDFSFQCYGSVMACLISHRECCERFGILKTLSLSLSQKKSPSC